MIRKSLVLTAAAAALLATILAPSPTAATLIVNQVFSYNFDNGFVAAGGLATQDGWVGTNGGVLVAASTSPFNTTSFPSETGLKLNAGSATLGTFRHNNNGNFTFSILDNAPRFDLEFTTNRGNGATGINTQAQFGLTTDATGSATSTPRFYFGVIAQGGGGTPTANRARWGISTAGTAASVVRDTDQTLTGTPDPDVWESGGNTSWRVRLQINIGAGNVGTASLFQTPLVRSSGSWSAPLVLGTEAAQIDGELQNISLGTLPALSTFKQLYLTMSNFTNVDNLKITTFETAVPEIAVSGNSVNIANGDASPSLLDFTDFGTTTTGSPLSRVFRVDNTGTDTLTTSGLTVPAGFTVTEPLSGAITPGGFDTFTVELTAASPGIFSGNVSFVNNDADGGDGIESPFIFAITGTVNAIPEPSTLLLGSTGLLALALFGWLRHIGAAIAFPLPAE